MIKAIKVTNPFYITLAGPELKKYVERIRTKTITYEGFVTFLCNTAQCGGNFSEVWMVLEDDKPVAFAQWNLCTIPHTGTWSWNHVGSWTKNKEAFEILVEKCFEFGARNNCTYLLGQINGKKLVEYYREKCNKMGIKMEKLDYFPVIFKKE